MKKYQVTEVEQMELLTVKEGGKRVPAKRVDIYCLTSNGEGIFAYV